MVAPASLCSEHLTPLPEPLLGPVAEVQMPRDFGMIEFWKLFSTYSFPLGDANCFWENGSKGHLLMVVVVCPFYLFIFKIDLYRAVLGSQQT